MGVQSSWISRLPQWLRETHECASTPMPGGVRLVPDRTRQSNVPVSRRSKEACRDMDLGSSLRAPRTRPAVRPRARRRHRRPGGLVHSWRLDQTVSAQDARRMSTSDLDRHMLLEAEEFADYVGWTLRRAVRSTDGLAIPACTRSRPTRRRRPYGHHSATSGDLLGMGTREGLGIRRGPKALRRGPVVGAFPCERSTRWRFSRRGRRRGEHCRRGTAPIRDHGVGGRRVHRGLVPTTARGSSQRTSLSRRRVCWRSR